MQAGESLRGVVITGAAGALGRAVAARFARDGARLALIDRELAPLQAAFGGMGGTPPPLLHAADVTSPDAMAQAAGVILGALGQVDVLVHVAGGFEMGEPVHALSRAAWQRMMDLNAWSLVAVTGPFLPPMLARGSGRVVAVSARSAAAGVAGMSAYCASKSALQRLVESLSQEVRGAGVHVNSVAPSVLDTPANRQAMPDADPSAWVSTAQAAEAIAFLASAAADAVHGRHLVLDGLS